MKDYTYINTGKIITPIDLINSGDVDDSTIIEIYDARGGFVSKGPTCMVPWSGWGRLPGMARKVGTGHTVSFRFA